jgi:hypothetical protein
MSLATSIGSDLPAAPVAKKARSPRVTKPPVVEATTRKPGKVAKGCKKVSFYLSPEVIRRLGITAVAEGLDTSEVLEGILAQAPALKRWVLQDRAKPSDQATLETSTD